MEHIMNIMTWWSDLIGSITTWWSDLWYDTLGDTGVAVVQGITGIMFVVLVVVTIGGLVRKAILSR